MRRKTAAKGSSDEQARTAPKRVRFAVPAAYLAVACAVSVVPIGSIISAAGSLAGDLLSAGEQKRAQRSSRAFQERWNQKSLEEAQRQFRVLTRETIQRRVSDAKAAGLHPLYALGAASASPVSFAAGAPTPASGSYLGEGLRDVGKAIGAEFEARSPKSRRAAAELAAERGSARRLADAQGEYYATASVRNLAEAQAALSDAKRAELVAASTGLGRGVQQWTPMRKGNRARAAVPGKARSIETVRGDRMSVGAGDPVDVVEQEYGEIADYVHGFPRWVRDYTRHLEKRLPVKRPKMSTKAARERMRRQVEAANMRMRR